jgi:hypothetical protein
MVLPGVGAYAASKSALNMLSPVIRRSLHPTASLSPLSIPRSLPPSSTTSCALEACMGIWRPRPAHPAVRGQGYRPAIRTGEAEVIIPHGPERLEKMEITDSQT